LNISLLNQPIEETLNRLSQATDEAVAILFDRTQFRPLGFLARRVENGLLMLKHCFKERVAEGFIPNQRAVRQSNLLFSHAR
jgi:hypothetical protein